MILQRIGLEIGARQIVQKHIKGRGEQILPTLAQMTEQRLFVLNELVETAVEGILLDQRIIGAEQISHRALIEPLTM